MVLLCGRVQVGTVSFLRELSCKTLLLMLVYTGLSCGLPVVSVCPVILL